MNMMSVTEQTEKWLRNESSAMFLLNEQLDKHGLHAQGWTFDILDELPKDYFGYTNFELKIIQLNRDHWPTKDRNIIELVRHEVAHALCGHGRHDLEWWDKLIELGGCGVWVDENGEVSQARITD